MRRRIVGIFASALTISLGLVTLLGLLLTEDLGIPANFVQLIESIANILLQLVTITIALSIIIGVINLIIVHVRRFTRRGQGEQRGGGISALYSVVLLASFFVAIGLYFADRDEGLVVLDTVQFAVESSLAGLLLFALVFGAYRLMYRRVTWSRMLFTVVLLVVLVGALPLAGVGVVQDLRAWLLAVPVSAGARGILLGIALATLVTGIRVLIGIDRSYRE